MKTAPWWNSSIVIQCGCENCTAVEQLWGHSMTAAFSTETSEVFQLSQQNPLFSGKNKCALPAIGELAQMHRRPLPNPHSLIGPRVTILISPNRATLIRTAQCLLDRRSFNPTGWNRIPGNLYKGWERWQKHNAGRQFSAEAGRLGFSTNGCYAMPFCCCCCSVGCLLVFF